MVNLDAYPPSTSRTHSIPLKSPDLVRSGGIPGRDLTSALMSGKQIQISTTTTTRTTATDDHPTNANLSGAGDGNGNGNTTTIKEVPTLLHVKIHEVRALKQWFGENTNLTRTRDVCRTEKVLYLLFVLQEGCRFERVARWFCRTPRGVQKYVFLFPISHFPSPLAFGNLPFQKIKAFSYFVLLRQSAF